MFTQTTKKQIIETIGHQIRLIRKLHGLTGEKFAKKIGVSQQQMSRYELGHSKISADTLLCLLIQFNVPAERFFQDVSLSLRNISHEFHNENCTHHDKI